MVGKNQQLLVTGVPSVVAEDQIVEIRGLRATRIPFQNHGHTPPFVMVDIILAHFFNKCKFKNQQISIFTILIDDFADFVHKVCLK